MSRIVLPHVALSELGSECFALAAEIQRSGDYAPGTPERIRNVVGRARVKMDDLAILADSIDRRRAEAREYVSKRKVRAGRGI